MFMSKRAVLRTLASALEATRQAYQNPSRGTRHGLAKQETYQAHMLMTLQTVMATMAQALCKNDRDAAKDLLESLSAE